ncbi:GyrI-like domain-containing protein [Saccharothrix sp.]|uniref:GyrI-like domain-containing protein n=1 Tax=Saccharothrix sp. TaxID=1873460 RepID=UPI0028112C56|nr:GyrI-like domain-containing protein [Saccharothrix sp.]
MTPTLTTHGPTTYLSVTGQGEPGGTEHVTAMQALYTVAAAMGTRPGPLEGQWWAEDERPALEVPRDQWRWHLLLPLPAPQDGQVERAREQTRATCPAVDRVRLATVAEGQCVELLHDGPFSEEHLSLKVMEEFIAEHDLAYNGLHHEIYLTPLDDPSPRTLLRQPVRPAAQSGS